MVKKRNPFLAALLSFIYIGTGQIYNGELAKSIYLQLFLIAMTFAFYATMYFFDVSLVSMYAYFLFGLMIRVYSIFEAYINANKKTEQKLKKFQKWYIYIFYAIFFQVALLVFVDTVCRKEFVQFYRLPSQNMLPTMIVGDQIASKSVVDQENLQNKINRGTVINFKYPRDETVIYSSRLIAHEGDEVEIKGKSVYVNGIELERKKIELTSKLTGFQELRSDDYDFYEEVIDQNSYTIMYLKEYSERNRGNIKIKVSKGHFFFLGDHRDNSNDSRFVGLVPYKNIVGAVKNIFYSKGEGIFDFRWNRFGINIE